MRSCGKGKYQSMDNAKIGIKRGNLVKKKLQGLWMKGTNKPKEHIGTYLIHFKTHRGLFQSEENKCMWIQVKMAPSLSVFTYIYFLLIEKYLCEIRNVPTKFPCALLVYLFLSSSNLIFSVRVFPFIHIFVLFNMFNFCSCLFCNVLVCVLFM